MFSAKRGYANAASAANCSQNRNGQFRPLSKQQVRQLEKESRIEHVWSSNAIEGNHLDRFETASILNTGVTVHGASVKDIKH
ncbi:hypothetical protein [Secundilactobacillus kimchicus]|uniref:hypothetical protein n=1 Tax=Secundilactobacillus kimchicus TaxID=528209 RepID=UPI0024A83C6B|nr:hypothetical protein [Secundilactobacillus kimchicus]